MRQDLDFDYILDSLVAITGMDDFDIVGKLYEASVGRIPKGIKALDRFKELSNKDIYLNTGRHHSDNIPAYIGSSNKIWYKGGLMCNASGPASIHTNGTKSYYIINTLHRTDGPAVEYHDGRKDFLIKGIHLTKEEYLAAGYTCTEE